MFHTVEGQNRDEYTIYQKEITLMVVMVDYTLDWRTFDLPCLSQSGTPRIIMIKAMHAGNLYFILGSIFPFSQSRYSDCCVSRGAIYIAMTDTVGSR